LSTFAQSIESSLGPSQGALAAIGLASPGGELNLQEEAVAKATPAGTGSVHDTRVTYFDVTIDMTKLADTPGLSDVQRQTIEDALPLLRRGGYTGTTERIGVDDDGYIREVTATNHFTDGSTGPAATHCRTSVVPRRCLRPTSKRRLRRPRRPAGPRTRPRQRRRQRRPPPPLLPRPRRLLRAHPCLSGCDSLLR
jgi:hypothetical protein